MDFVEILKSEPGLAARARRLRREPEALFPVLSAKIKLTWRCNLKCQVCALWRQTGPDGQGPPSLPPETVRRVLEDLASQGLRKVHFSGGEVFLYPDLEEVVCRARDLGLQVNLTTNGTLLDKNQARWLVEARVHTVAFSLDDIREKKHDEMRGVPGAWRRTWRGIGRLRDRIRAKGRGPLVAVNTLITRRNIERLPELRDLLLEQGVDSWRLLPVRTQDKKLRPRAEQWAEAASWLGERPSFLTRDLAGARSWKDARRAAKGLYAGRSFDDEVCYAPWFSLFVDADGTVFSCCTGRRHMPCYGLAGEEKLADIMVSEPRREVLAAMASGHVYDICRSCDEFLVENEAFARGGPVEVEE